MSNEIIERSSDREEYLEEIKEVDKELDKALDSMLTIRQREEIAGKEKIRDIAKIVKSLLESEYVRFKDGSNLSYSDMLAASVVANMVKNRENIGAKELVELQKVVGESGSRENESKGIQINIVSNGVDIDKI